MKTENDLNVGDLVSFEGKEFRVYGFKECEFFDKILVISDRLIDDMDLFCPDDLELIERKEAYSAPNKPPVELILNPTLSITIPSGATLLEGLFCDENGERYEVSIRRV